MLEVARYLAHHALRLRGVSHHEQHIDGATMRYYRLGHGPRLVILLHGLGDSATNWRAVAHGIAGQAEVIIPDLPGFGRSVLPAGELHWPHSAYRAALHRFLAPWADRDPLIVGNSMGGWLSVQMMLDRPDLYRRTILINPGGIILPEAERARDTFRDFLATADGRSILAKLLHRPPQAFALLAPGLERQMRSPVVQQFLNTIAEADMLTTADVVGLSPDNVLVWGDEDRFLPLGSGEAWFRHFPGKVIHLPAVGHMAQLERPDRVTDIILDQLRLSSGLAK